MKKIFLFIPFLLITFGCVESELVIPGENVGNVDDIDDTPTTTVLKQLTITSPLFSNSYNFNSEGLLTSYSTSAPARSLTVSYTGNKITSVTHSPQGVYSQSYAFTYNDQNQLTEINAGTTPENKIVFTHTATGITGVRTVEGIEANTITFSKDNAGYINGYSFADAVSGETLALNLIVGSNLLTSSEVTLGGTVSEGWAYTFDNKINPVYQQSIDQFNAFVMNDAFEFSAAEPVLDQFSYALFRSGNNILTATATTGTVTSALNFAYQYNSDDYPESAVITIEGQQPGSSVYTYY